MRNVSCNWINNRLLVGGIIDSEADLIFLKEAGITHIVNAMQEDRERAWCQAQGLAYLHNGLPDDGKPKPVSWFKTTLDWVLPALAYPRTKVYVHCRGGVQRGPSQAYAILRAQGWSSEAAERFIRSVRQVGLGYMNDANAAISELGYN